MCWLGLNLNPDIDINDLIQRNDVQPSSSVDWFLKKTYFPSNAFHNQHEEVISFEPSFQFGESWSIFKVLLGEDVDGLFFFLFAIISARKS